MYKSEEIASLPRANRVPRCAGQSESPEQPGRRRRRERSEEKKKVVRVSWAALQIVCLYVLDAKKQWGSN